MQEAPFIAIARHRIGIDGEGITTLAAFHGCPLQCRYCLNRRCLHPDGIWQNLSTAQLLEEVSKDNLYFLATGGGVTFGGGEPCLRSLFIEEFCQMMDHRWRITIETCLNVERHHVERLMPLADQWMVDIKDMNADIYRNYTRKDNKQAIDNLKWLLSQNGLAEKVIVRLPHIPNYNTPDDVNRSRHLLEAMGAKFFDEFEYLEKDQASWQQ